MSNMENSCLYNSCYLSNAVERPPNEKNAYGYIKML